MRTLAQRWAGYRLYWRIVSVQRRGRERETDKRLWCGDLDAARLLLARDRRPAARFELACLELEAGDVVAAQRATAALPDVPARAVLAQLLERPPQAGAYRGGATAGWLAALVDAWHRAGRPDLSGAELPSHDFLRSYDQGERGKCGGADARAVWSVMTQRSGWLPLKPRALVRWAIAPVERSLADHAIATNVIAQRIEPEIDEPARRALARLDELAPGQLWVKLAAVARRPPGPLTDAELRELAAIAEVPVVDATISPAVHARFLEVARASGSGSPEPLAYAGLLRSVLVLPSFKVMQRLGATTDRRAAELSVRIGRRMLEDRTLITFLCGRMFMRKGAEVLDDQRVFDELALGNDEQAAFSTIGRKPMLDPLRWPIPSLAREVIAALAESELAFHRASLRRELSRQA